MQKATSKKSVDTLYEIKAPLASFDTIDLDDFDINHGHSVHSLKALSPERCTPKSLESTFNQKDSQEINNLEKVDGDPEIVPQLESLEDDPGTPTYEEKFKDDIKVAETSKSEEDNAHDAFSVIEIDTDIAEAFKADYHNDSDIEEGDMTESGNITPTGASTGSKDANSSENNASAEEIQIKLKEKGRKHKEKASNVKYQQIDSFSDVSDQEKESPLPTVKKKSEPKECNSDSESTDSDSGYIRKGYQSSNNVFVKKGSKTPDTNQVFNVISDFVDSRDSTPYTSPKPRRPTVPPPLSEEESAIISKRKAYEKRLQRLQVTTNPIERPRSTTPINIYGFEEYVNISSPERSPANLQKLKIKLPLDESTKGKSPRRSAKLSAHRSAESGDPHVFTFNEDLLFTHTKSAILLEDDISKGFSPKRVLVPPTLSPKVSPRNLPSKSIELENSSKYMYYPWENSPNEETVNKLQDKSNNSSTADSDNWAKFDSDKELPLNETSDKTVSETVAMDVRDSSDSGNEQVADPISGVNDFNIDPATFLKEEILTVHIDEIGNSRTCDISYEPVEKNTSEQNADLKMNGDNNKDTKLDKELTLNSENSLKTECAVCMDNEEDLGTPV